MIVHFNRTFNILEKRHEKIVNLFIDGKISYLDFELYENRYNRIKHLYTISLN